MNEKADELEIGFSAETGELYSLDKKERIVVKEVLKLALVTPSGRKEIRKRFGEKGFRTAKTLLEQMGVTVEST
jgi:hypothetical protein